MKETIYLPATRDDGETEVMVEFTVWSWGSPAQTSGPPERCYEAEPMEVEITDCWLTENNKEEVTLTDAEEERIIDMFYANPPEPDFGKYDESGWRDRWRDF